MSATTQMPAELVDLVRADIAIREEVYPAAPVGVCRFCGKRWQRMAGGKLEGHSVCAVSDDVRVAVVQWLDADPHHSMARAAACLGLASGTIRAWWAHNRRAALRPSLVRVTALLTEALPFLPDDMRERIEHELSRAA